MPTARQCRDLFLTFALCAGAVVAAPVPRLAAPDSGMVGTWDWTWGGSEGAVTFFADGTYCSHHGGAASYVGYWSFDGHTVWLWQYPAHGEAAPTQVQRYWFTAAPTLTGYAGRTSTGTDARLARAKK